MNNNVFHATTGSSSYNSDTTIVVVCTVGMPVTSFHFITQENTVVEILNNE